jgi:fatty-acyl-CoA synthase
MEFFERLKADLICLGDSIRALRYTTHIAKNPTRVFPQLVEELAEKYGDAPALLSDRETYSYRELGARSNRYARWALAQGIAKGDTICLLMPNRPEFLAVWLGVTRIGGVVSLLNTNLMSTALAHCINVVAPRHIIVDADMLPALKSALPHLVSNAKLWLYGDAIADMPRLNDAIEELSGSPLTRDERCALTIEDRALFIYTSGTTGLPKAANVNHYRLMLATHAFAAVMNIRASDRMYDCLPLYHTSGGVLATGSLLLKGGSVVIRERFSAREFWDDVVRWECTLLQYIGEFCRYLVNSPPNPKEREHKLRLVCGNGLRPDVWAEFKRRFQIPRIIEFYAATEGNVTIFNWDGKEGAVGRVPWFLAHRFPIKVVRFDVERQQPVRTADGLCVECDYDEPGEVIGKIVRDASKPAARFEGYATQAETDKKILHDVFDKGDTWFRTGDLMRKDARGYFYFVDRIGDTFRWKGENVSTTEVAEALGHFDGVHDANVYGVSVPGRDGRAGMAALVVDGNLNLSVLWSHLAERLPDYARPVFLRIRRDMEMTATFKQKKIDLAQQGFDPEATGDPIFFNDPTKKAFVRVDAELYKQICSGDLRL